MERVFWARVGPYTKLKLWKDNTEWVAEGWMATAISSDGLPHGTEIFLSRIDFTLLQGKDELWIFQRNNEHGEHYEPPVIEPGEIVIVSGSDSAAYVGCEIGCKCIGCEHRDQHLRWGMHIPHAGWGLRRDAAAA